jgi:transposase-like protein
MSETNGSSGSSGAEGSKRARRKFGAADKLRIVLAGLQADTNVSQLCRREGITATQFYQWKDRLLGSASKVFEEKTSGPSVEQERAEAQLKRMKDVIAEITAENVELKKTLLD